MQKQFGTLTRRVYKSELKDCTGWSDTWIRKLVARGHIPPGRTDPGGKRLFWTSQEADAMIQGQRSVPGERAA